MANRQWGASPADIGSLTNATQLGFILGTLAFAVTGLADRFPASRIFAVCAVLGALANAGFAFLAGGIDAGILWRFAVGLSLAGVYPLGMKLVVSWVPQQAGAALAWLVGMLTLGTALPHGVRMLDVGCGPALVAEGARDIVGAAGSVVGLDPSLGMLRSSRLARASML